MSHGNARLTFHGRRLIVHRVCDLGMPQAHVADAMGVPVEAVAEDLDIAFQRLPQERLAIAVGAASAADMSTAPPMSWACMRCRTRCTFTICTPPCSICSVSITSD